MMITYQYELMNTLNTPNELVMKQKTMTLTQDVPFQNLQLPMSRTGQSGRTHFFVFTQSHIILLYGNQA